MSDNLLVSKAKAGDSNALTELIKNYSNLVSSKSMSFSKNSGVDSDDLYQEGMIGLLSAVYSFDESREIEFKTFAETVINRKMFSALRSANSKKNLPLASYISLEDKTDILSSMPSPEETYLISEELSLINDFVEKNLSKTEKKVLRLHLLELSYSEIAEILDCSEKTVDNALQRIRKKIKGNKPF